MAEEKLHIPHEFIDPSGEFIAATESIGLYWWYWNNVERKLSVSPALLRVMGYTPEEFDPSKPSIYRNIHPDDVIENLKRVRRLIYGEDSLYEIEFRVKDSKGEWQWCYNRGAVIQRDENGKGTLIGGITMDISGQFKQLMAKVEEKEKFEFIFRNTNEAVVIIELKEGIAGRVMDANKAALELFDQELEEMKHWIPPEFINDDMIGERGELVREVMEKGFGRAELKLKISEDKTRWLEITAHSFMLTGENLMIAIAKDITRGKKTEAALRETERLYRTLFEAADDPIGLFSMDREIILINSAFYTTFGYDRDEFMAQEWMEIIHPEDKKVLDSLGVHLIQEGNLSVDYRVTHKSGHYLFVSSKNVVIHGEPGEKDLILTIIRDVTERKEAMKELEEAKVRAEESDKLKSAFLANMSHEIRTPMNSIVGFSNLLVNPGLDEATRSMYVQRIVRNSELLLALISDIIDLAKIESGQLPIIYGKLKLAALIGEMKQYAYDELKRLHKTGIKIITEIKHGDCEIETDVIRLNQIMKNLINNAIKFTETGTVKIGCQQSDQDQKVTLFVEDTGVGIAPEHFDLIFDQFRQIDGSNTRKFGGTGLGLAICRNLVHMMGGRIWVDSTEGKGALFQIELPAQASRQLEPEEKKALQPETAFPASKTFFIMVVDDEQDSVELFRELLAGIGHEVVTASSGYEALKLMEKPPLPDLIFMDVEMPVLSGSETMRIMKQRYGHIRIVAQSAHALVGDRARFLQEGFDAYLPKPFTGEQFADIMSVLFPG